MKKAWIIILASLLLSPALLLFADSTSIDVFSLYHDVSTIPNLQTFFLDSNLVEFVNKVLVDGENDIGTLYVRYNKSRDVSTVFEISWVNRLYHSTLGESSNIPILMTTSVASGLLNSMIENKLDLINAINEYKLTITCPTLVKPQGSSAYWEVLRLCDFSVDVQNTMAENPAAGQYIGTINISITGGS